MICLSRWCFMTSDGADKDKTYPVKWSTHGIVRLSAKRRMCLRRLPTRIKTGIKGRENMTTVNL